MAGGTWVTRLLGNSENKDSYWTRNVKDLQHAEVKGIWRFNHDYFTHTLKLKSNIISYDLLSIQCQKLF